MSEELRRAQEQEYQARETILAPAVGVFALSDDINGLMRATGYGGPDLSTVQPAVDDVLRRYAQWSHGRHPNPDVKVRAVASE